jgi:TonB-dependent receptor
MPVLNPTPSRAARYAAPVALLTALLLGPAAAQSVSDDPIEMEALEVTAFSSQARALDLRRNATEISDALSADNVGLFPDQNVAEALQRVPGLSVQRDQGEGRAVVIRGIDPSFNSTTINGLRIPGPESDSRSVNLDAISSDLVESIIVSKAVTPDMDADAVGGNIEIKTLSAFDRGARNFNLTLGGSYNTTNEETSPDLSLAYSNVFTLGNATEPNFGFAFAFSQFDRDTVSDGIEGAPWELVETPAGNEVNALLEGEQRDYILTRKRTSVTLNFDFRPSETTTFYLRTLYSEFDDAEVKQENVFKFEDGDILTLDANGGTFEGAEYVKAHADSNKIVEITSLSFGGKHDLEPWFFDYSIGYAEAGEAGDLEITGETIAEDVSMGYSITENPQKPRLFVIGQQGTRAADFALDSAEGENVFTEERELALAFNSRRDVTWGADAPGFVQFGWKTRFREKESDVNLSIYEGFPGDFTIADFARDRGVKFPLPGDFGPVIDPAKYRDFFFGNRDEFELEETDSDLDSRAQDYDLTEDIHAAYLMAQGEFGAFTLLGGVRIENTQYAVNGTQVSIDENVNDGDPVLSPFSDEKDYTYVLPNLHFTYAVSDRINVRGALTQTIARPNFEAAGPFQIIEIEGEGDDIERVAEKGNPDLEPLESTNFDLRWEYYPGSLSLVSVGVFYKDISNYFLVANTAGRPGFENFDEVTETINGGDASLFGIELGYVRQLDFLPGFLDGMLFDASYTYTDSEADIPERASGIRLPGQSDHITSLALGYEKHGLSIRLAAVFRSAYFEEADDPSDPAFDRYQDDHLQIDLTARYRINSTASVYLNVINLNDEPLYAYWGDSRYNSQYETYGPTVEAGVRLAF